MSTVFRVEKTANFTVMANIHLKDRRISLKSKGLLSVILSLPPDWDYTITGLAHIAADGVDSVKTAVRELERYGYVTRRQLRDERGRMARNEYIVYENPAENPDYIPPEQTTPEQTTPEQNAPENNAAAKKPKKSAPKKKHVFSVSPSAENPSAVSPTADNTQADTFIELNKNISNTDKSIHSFTPAQARGNGIGAKDKSKSGDEWELFSELIRGNIRYKDKYARKIGDSQQVDELVTIMTDVVCSSAPTIRVNGEDVPHEVIKSRFLKLTDEEIDYVLHALERSGRIRNMRSYLITALYNAKSTVSNYYANMAYNDIREGSVR